ncbi:MAG TPA: DUF835 domain-containing protein [Thermoplasmata archaeon]
MTVDYSTASAATAEPKPGNVYLVEERKPKTTYDLFDQAVYSGYSGLVVTRDYPKKLLSDKELSSCKVLWLTNLVGEGRINPTAVGILMGQIRTFIEGQPRSVVVLDGLEYLSSLNTYDRMLQFMHQLKDVVVTNDSILLVPLDPRTLSTRELAMLERSAETIVPKSETEPQDEGLLSEGEEGVLKLMDARNR